jgi:hypothetical protein
MQYGGEICDISSSNESDFWVVGNEVFQILQDKRSCFIYKEICIFSFAMRYKSLRFCHSNLIMFLSMSEGATLFLIAELSNAQHCP